MQLIFTWSQLFRGKSREYSRRFESDRKLSNESTPPWSLDKSEKSHSSEHRCSRRGNDFRKFFLFGFCTNRLNFTYVIEPKLAHSHEDDRRLEMNQNMSINRPKKKKGEEISSNLIGDVQAIPPPVQLIRKQVRFNEVVDVFFCPSLDDMSAETLRAVYFSAEEYSAIKKDTIEELQECFLLTGLRGKYAMSYLYQPFPGCFPATASNSRVTGQSTARPSPYEGPPSYPPHLIPLPPASKHFHPYHEADCEMRADLIEGVDRQRRVSNPSCLFRSSCDDYDDFGYDTEDGDGYGDGYGDEGDYDGDAYLDRMFLTSPEPALHLPDGLNLSSISQVASWEVRSEFVAY